MTKTVPAVHVFDTSTLQIDAKIEVYDKVKLGDELKPCDEVRPCNEENHSSRYM